MKKIFTFCAWMSVGISAAAQTYVYQTYDNFAASNYSLVKDLAPATVSGNPNQVALVDLLNPSSPNNTYFSINIYNNGIGTPVSGNVFTLNSSTNNMYAKRVLEIGGDFYILFSYTDGSSIQRFAVLQYSLTSGIVWARYFSGNLNGSQGTADMDYDGSNYLYLTGDLRQQSHDLWAAKIDLSGNLVWYYTYADNGNSADEAAWNIHYKSDTEIYIGATTSVTSGSDQAGLIVQIDNNGNVSTARKIRFYPYPSTPQQWTERLYVKSDGTDIYTVALSFTNSIPSTLFVARLNTSFVVQNCHQYDATSFRLLPEFLLVNGDIVVSGKTDPLSSQTQSYINQFFDMSTTSFVTAARHYSTISNNSYITLSSDPSNYNIFNTANVGATTGVIYRIKGAAGTGSTECDTAFQPDSLSLDTAFLNFNIERDSLDTNMRSLSFKVKVLSPVDTLTCDTGSSAQRLARKLADAVTYPNPFSHALYVQPRTGGNVLVEIHALDGRLILQREYREGESIIISGDTIVSGLYLLNITYTTGATETRKIIRE